jgi:hypothetical protein
MTPTIFLCEPSRLNVAQRLMSDRWHERLFGLGYDVEQLRDADYEPDPWPGLKRRMRAAHGVIVLGFRQLSVSAGTWRVGAELETGLAETWSSPWLQVEVGLAVAAGLPLLVVPEHGVREGAFAPETWTWPNAIFGTPMAAPDGAVVDSWARSVAERFAPSV